MSCRENEEADKNHNNHCCISHEFLNAATKNPNKVAVIHASSDERQQLLRESIDSSSSSHPVYEGDCSFTFSDIATSVESLASRISSLLGSSDDPHLIKPQHQGSSRYLEAREQTVPTNVSHPWDDQHSDFHTYAPKILGIYMQPSVEYIVSVLSVLRCGEAFLPLDPSWPKDRILSIISCSKLDLIITCGSSFGNSGNQPVDESHWLVESNRCRILCFSMDENDGDRTKGSSLVWPCKKQKQRAFCYLMYTSGSTGKPKGVCGTERGLLNRFLWMIGSYPLHRKELLLFKTSVSFIDHLQEFLCSVLGACTLVIPQPIQLKQNMFSILSFLQAYRISRLIAVPSLIRAILPALRSQEYQQIRNSLKVLVLSGEVLPLSLWDMISTLLPETSVLNLYGSTEVSGDCTYFDCKMLPNVLGKEKLTSVPIGIPISNCDVVLLGDGDDDPDEGEMCVGGLCVSSGYMRESTITSPDCVKLRDNFICNHSTNQCGHKTYIKTGDFGRRISSGDLIFIGRKDRTIKLNGQRIALEEIESTITEHPDIADAAVIFDSNQEELAFLKAFLVLKQGTSSENVRSLIKNWMLGKLPPAMVPNCFVLVESLPMSSTGKVDYQVLACLTCSKVKVEEDIASGETNNILQLIKKAFCNALAVDEVSDDDDFFVIGGNSIAAAQASHNLGIDMRLLYEFPTPSKLSTLLLEGKGMRKDVRISLPLNLEAVSNLAAPAAVSCMPKGLSSRTPLEKNDDHVISKRRKMDLGKYVSSNVEDGYPWNSSSTLMHCSFSRCNKVLNRDKYRTEDTCQKTWSMEVPDDRTVSLEEIWKVPMESCVDASPLVVFKESEIYLFIGSHSHKFLCIDAKSGSVQWENTLEGRVECSAVVVGDFSQVVVGCYKGKIYFLDFSNGGICWTFQTCGEVKCQPAVDARRQLIWCGSHDHNLYALDYKNHCCVYKIPCGGSIFGSPAVDEECEAVYVASTSGRVTATSTEVSPFHTLWLLELEVPIFGSLSLSLTNGTVICCLVDGHVIALNSTGDIIWKFRTGGPVFSGACMSSIFPSQVIISSRNGSIYSFELGKGDLIWEYNVGSPIVASAYVDENLQLLSDPYLPADRLICVCTSSGTIHLLRVKSDKIGKSKETMKDTVQEFALLKLQGDIFSSPVMIGGRIFVGSRDDYVHCVSVGT